MNEKINELNKKVDERLAGGFKETSETIAFCTAGDAAGGGMGTRTNNIHRG